VPMLGLFEIGLLLARLGVKRAAKLKMAADK